eukprot:1321276-Rhodomonas_salina.3
MQAGEVGAGGKWEICAWRVAGLASSLAWRLTGQDVTDSAPVAVVRAWPRLFPDRRDRTGLSSPTLMAVTEVAAMA